MTITPPSPAVFTKPRRSPYWRRGMERGAPWVALAECNTGQFIVPCGTDPAAAAAAVRRWRSIAESEQREPSGRRIVGAAVVDPHGDIVSSWALNTREGHTPNVGGPPRWTPLMRVSQATECGQCHTVRWPGCWMAPDLDGCAQCMPADEVGDPREWPKDPLKPRERPVVVKDRAPRKTKTTRRTKTVETVTPAQARL